MASDFHGAPRTQNQPGMREIMNVHSIWRCADSAVWPFLNGKEPDGHNVRR